MSRRQPRCNECRRPVVWFTNARTGTRRPFDPRPVDGRTHQGAPAMPVESERAWLLPALVTELEGRREVSTEEATQEAYDVPWYVPHTCTRPTPPDARPDVENGVPA